MSRVFVVSEPLRWDEEQRAWVRSRDLSPAREHGELVFLLPPGNEGPADPAVAIATLTEKLAGFTVRDYLLPIGHPLYLAWAAAIAARAAGGRLRLLHWRPRERRYHVVAAELWRGAPGGASVPAPVDRAGENV